jgi:zinc protease
MMFRGYRLFAVPALLLATLVAPAPARAIDIERVISAGGIEAWLVEDHSLPIVSMQFRFPGGAATDPAGKEGLANMVSGLLDEGAGDLDSRAFQQRLADQSISLSYNVTLDSFSGSLKTLSRNRDEAFELLRLSLTAPRFDTDAVERIRTQIQAGIRARANDPNTIARRTFREAVFAGHPYGRSARGTEESVAAIGHDDLATFVARRLARSELIVGVVGDITPAELATRLDAVFGGLPERAEAFSIPKADPAVNGEIIVVERDNPQSRVVFGQRGIYRDDPDYYAALVLNHIIGGGSFTSRLYDEVREKRGLAYSVFSYLLPLENAAMWMGGAGTENAAVAQSVSIIRAQWEHARRFAVSQDEIDAAKANLIGSFGLRLDSTSAIAGMLVAVQARDLGIGYLNERDSLIEAVTLDDVRRVGERLLDPQNLTVVVVGKPENLEATRVIPDGG